MKKEIQELVDISRFYGNNKSYVIAGGGNTSFKDEIYIYVKASGKELGNIDKNDFVTLDRAVLNKISSKNYGSDFSKREVELKQDLYKSIVCTEKNTRPSVESSLHNCINYKFVVHTHPTLVNALMCSRNGMELTRKWFGSKVVVIEYTDPGYVLFKKVESKIKKYRQKFNKDPEIIFMQNHGVFVSADTTAKIKSVCNYIETVIKGHISKKPDTRPVKISESVCEILPAIRIILSEDGLKVAKIRNNSLIASFYKDEKIFAKASLPFTPDVIVYCKSQFLYIDKTGSTESVINEFRSKQAAFKKKYGYSPKVIMIKDIGLIAVEDNNRSAETVLDVYEDLLHISYYSENFGGPRFMSEKEFTFIDNWEAENYRRKVAKSACRNGKVENKIIIITGSAQGFGQGIAEDFFSEGANIVIANINQDKGKSFAQSLNKKNLNNKAIYKKTDISDPDSVQGLINETVKEFGGLDIIVSNAGILKAGSLEEMNPATFELMTKINYTGYYLCAKYASKIMKLQNKYNPEVFSDIIQVNSKSGLKGSSKNFTYSGGKFGGVGLTQSFALELAPFRIKVNSICPGNYFEGPLWSDPKTGLFMQYLKGGKVPGAKNIDDIKRYYENQVPLKRGCLIEDLMKAIYYVVEQKYETGQAVPVTGGQIMLS